jgi:murein DD-endopeptidase MepM/ murein hydrolase activator NlpD|tara:strand:- start:142 stop:738 length:597 start_codon:yes stop_codon:yes gene_type:complete
MSKRKSFIFIGIFILVSLLNQSQLNAKHSKFLETMVFPVKNIMSHFYDDWGEIRGNGERVHEGIDIRARKGSPIVAIADGRVNTVSFTQSSGYYIAIDHQNGWLSLYVHLNDDINENDNLGGRQTAFADGIYLGAEVIAGQTIGYVGDSGNAEGTVPHVHFEVRYMGKSYDIYDYIKLSWERFERFIKFPKKMGINLF